MNLYDLMPGDKVFWDDPDNGSCSRIYIIDSIKVDDDDRITITEADGSVLECYANELRFIRE